MKTTNRTQQNTTELQVSGMSCAACSARVEGALNALPEVSTATVNLATERATIASPYSAETLIACIEQAGYQASVLHSPQQQQQENSERKKAQLQSLKHDLILAVLLTLPIFILEMGSHLFHGFQHYWLNRVGQHNLWLGEFVLTSIVMLFPGRRFYRLGIPALLKAAPDMNSLVAVGTLAAFLFSCVATFFPAQLPAGTVHVYYEAAAMIITLILVGRYLEARAKGKTSQAIQRLIDLQPKMARVKRQDKWVDTSLTEIVMGDILSIRPGETIPTDGQVIEGESYLDESMMSGEPVPVLKRVNDTVIGGTINQQGALTIQASAVGEATVLAQIIRSVEQAQGAKLPIQAKVDKVTLVFVPVIMGLALMTFLAWLVFDPQPALSLAMINAVAVLIIACPCAMGLATPTSIMVATGRGAELGILFRQGEALQQLNDVQVVALDKTGTITEGKPAVTDFIVMPDFSSEQVLTSIAAIESRSEHPLAQAMVLYAQEQQLSLPDVQQFNSHTGLGVSGVIGEQQIAVGGRQYMKHLGINLDKVALSAEALAQQGKSPFYAVINQQVAAVIAVSDPVKASSAEAIRQLQAQGKKVVMITGDNQQTAQAVAQSLGITDIVAEVLPQGKVAAIEQLQANHATLAFVGDGINDAPALAQADVGIALGTGTDIAMESADVVLMKGQLTVVAHAIALSQATLRNIRQNLFWALAYNVALIPVAAGVLYPHFGILLSPIFAAAAMALSSIFVLANALRLKRFQPK